MRLVKLRYNDGNIEEVENKENVDKIAFEIGNERYVITETYDDFFVIRKSNNALLVMPESSNSIKIR